MSEGLTMKYFVLKPKGEDIYAQASRAAMRAYANVIRHENTKFSDELRHWADQEHALANEDLLREIHEGELGR